MTDQDYSIVPDSGAHPSTWVTEGAIPASYSSSSAEVPFIQQTFLGASITNCSLNGGFGSSSSSLSANLVNDEYNASDGTALGLGDDVYHNGITDIFSPPPVGTPVFFKFGKERASVAQAWGKTFDVSYRTNLAGTVGANHLVFGGILQSYTQNRGPGGNPAYSINIADPREILSNVTIVLNNYAGTTYNNKNLFNVYGFLEYDVSDSLQAELDLEYPYLGASFGLSGKNLLTKHVNVDGTVAYTGNDLYIKPPTSQFDPAGWPPTFPVTGRGMSRRSSKGLPYYRVDQALSTLFNYNGALPPEYVERGFGGYIDFRGFKYIVDFSGIPLNKLPKLYSLNFDQIDLLSLAQELCEVMSHDLFVSLLPVIDHPRSSWVYNWNNYAIGAGLNGSIVAGIIRLDAIDRSQKPAYGSIKKYIDSLGAAGIQVENQDVGFELSNIVTDKFIVGAQDTSMYAFSTNNDRDFLEVRKFKNGLSNEAEHLLGEQWMLKNSLKQEVLPFYGFLGKEAVTIPRGFGSYQQILLDSTGLNAFGVGNYYIATEMELRCALVSFEKWKTFLVQYNDVYMESMEAGDSIEASLLLSNSPPPDFMANPDISNNYGVAVPRCVFNSDREYIGPDGLPASPCSPPYGYPLYFKRAEKIGIPEAGMAKIEAKKTQIVTNLAKLRSDTGTRQYRALTGFARNDDLDAIQAKQHSDADKILNNKDATDEQIAEANRAKAAANRSERVQRDEDSRWNAQVARQAEEAHESIIGYTQEIINRNCSILKASQRTAKTALANAQKVYSFIKDIANKHLGKTFLVQIPKYANLDYSNTVQLVNHGGATNRVNEIAKGPFGFKPEPISTDMGYTLSDQEIASLKSSNEYYTNGALKNNYNPMTDQYEYNYTPDPQGGFFHFSLYNNTMSPADLGGLASNSMPLAVQNLLCPQDMTNFVNKDGRMTAYVRYNNSQFYNFNGVPKSSMTQQVRSSVYSWVPDIVQELDNMKPDKFHSFNSQDLQRRAPAVAFVKCELNPKLYMAPKMRTFRGPTFARHCDQIDSYKKPRQIWDSGTCKYTNSYGYWEAHYVPRQRDGGKSGSVHQEDFVRNHVDVLNGDIINTSINGLDPDHVYAIITLPGRIQPTVDARCLDGPMQSVQAPIIKHLLTMDTVKGAVPGFNKPTVRGTPTNLLKDACASASVQSILGAFKAHEVSMSKLSIANPEAQMHFSTPSPVYPDLVVLPLQSSERCYGPWISSALDTQAARYKDIGGKIEFIKDENLAPWNYAGFQLMNEAGRLQAQFSNSLLLFGERGGFVFPGAPRGINLGAALMNGGPLVTNISVDISDAGVRTTYKMDLYTAKFGKLHKEREQQVGSIVRERQKLRDLNNDMIRRGIGKGQSTANLSTVLAQYNDFMAGANAVQGAVDHMEKTAIERGETIPTRLVLSAQKHDFAGHDDDGNPMDGKTYSTEGGFFSAKDHAAALQGFANGTDARRNFANTASVEVGEQWAIASEFSNYTANFPQHQGSHNSTIHYTGGLTGTGSMGEISGGGGGGGSTGTAGGGYSGFPGGDDGDTAGGGGAGTGGSDGQLNDPDGNDPDGDGGWGGDGDPNPGDDGGGGPGGAAGGGGSAPGY